MHRIFSLHEIYAYLGNVQGNVDGNYRKKWLKHKLLSPALFSKELAENNILFSKRNMKSRNQRQQNSVGRFAALNY